MRKLLLASAAMLGATSGIASAQVPTPAAANMMMQPSQGQMPLPWSQGPTADNNNNSYGQPSTYTGGAAYGANAVPTPGTVVIRLNGKVEFDADVWGGSTQVTQGTAAATGSNKLNPVTFGVFARLYPGVDGMATNGLRYGASIELRENFPGSVPQQTPLLSSAPSASAYSSGETIFVRRAFAYLAADNIGLVRVGQGDGVIGLFDPCIFSGQCYDAGTGNFNGGNIQAQMPAGAAVAGASLAFLAQGGAEYANTKIVYLSPQFFGFDLGVQYAPSMGNGESACGVPTVGATAAAQQAATTCNAVTTGSDPTRWFNQVGVGVRYQGVFGPWSVGAYGFWEGASKDDFFGPAVGCWAAALPAPYVRGNSELLQHRGLREVRHRCRNAYRRHRLHRRRDERSARHAADRWRTRVGLSARPDLCERADHGGGRGGVRELAGRAGFDRCVATAGVRVLSRRHIQPGTRPLSGAGISV